MSLTFKLHLATFLKRVRCTYHDGFPFGSKGLGTRADVCILAPAQFRYDLAYAALHQLC